MGLEYVVLFEGTKLGFEANNDCIAPRIYKPQGFFLRDGTHRPERIQSFAH